MEATSKSTIPPTLNLDLKSPMFETEISCIIRESLLVCFIVNQKGLEFLHSRAKIHRDIKCGKIILLIQGTQILLIKVWPSILIPRYRIN